MSRKRPLEGQLICTHPFEWFEIHPDGRVFTCCPAWLKTPIGNLLTDPIETVWNSPVAHAIRKTVLNGSFQYCNRKRCPRLASRTPPVMAAGEVANPETSRAIGRSLGTLPYGPKTLNLCFDHSCNLACPSCRQDITIAQGEALERAEAIAERIRTEAAPHVETLIVSGFGDPFGSPTYRRLLQGLAPEAYPRLQQVHLHTNGQLWDEKTWNALPALHSLVNKAEISIDAATAATYAENRKGGDFSRLLDNLAFLQSLPIEVKISFVVQHNNFREIPAFAELGARHGFAVYFSQLVNWGTFRREEYRRRAVHLPEHPEHGELCATLGRVARLGHVDAGNLSHLVAGE